MQGSIKGLSMSKRKQEGIHYVDAYVGKRLRQRRLMMKISQDQLASHVKLTFQQIQKYERGLNRISCSKLYEFSKFLEIDIGYFFRGLNEDSQVEAAESEENRDYISNQQPQTLVSAFNSIRNSKLKENIINIVCSLSDHQ